MVANGNSCNDLVEIINILGAENRRPPCSRLRQAIGRSVQLETVRSHQGADEASAHGEAKEAFTASFEKRKPDFSKFD
jgi:hypothetical protein